MVRSWRRKAASHRFPSDVPAGHVAICVGINCRRFIVRATYLNHPIFRRLLSQAEEEYGFANCSGPLAIPCDESLFEEILRLVARGDPISRCGRNENLDVFGESRPCGRNENLDVFGESRPLLFGFTA
ncbi:hypothetical protein DH2020_029577 [Rehmannia glutinosa]|uniref:Auxin-induced protein n=1 Tax=Rehmannia glutinosa TaxID=99300 RepID=A0ABR0VN75_REHGL